jgi:hypothetical protein
MELPDSVVARFAAGVINDHLYARDDPGWAINDCAPCAALYWLYVHRPDQLSAAVAEHMGADWDWQTDGKIDWANLSELIVTRVNHAFSA